MNLNYFRKNKGIRGTNTMLELEWDLFTLVERIDEVDYSGII